MRLLKFGGVCTVLVAALISAAPIANAACALPYTLTNGQNADATQVMADYNAIVTCLSSAVPSGAAGQIPYYAIAGTSLTPTSLSALIDATTSSTQGSILYRDATSWKALAPGTAQQFLQSGGPGANPAWGTPAGGGGGSGSAQTAMVMVAEWVPTAQAQSFTFSGLNGNADMEYEIHGNFVVGSGATGVPGGLQMTINGDNAANHYYYTGFYAGTTIAGGNVQVSNSFFELPSSGALTTGSEGGFDIWISAHSGQARIIRSMQRSADAPTDPWFLARYGDWTDTSNNITSITISGPAANSIGIGTRISLWARRTVGGTAVNVTTQTASYTLALTDAGGYVRQNVAAANNLTVPPNASVAFPIGTRIAVVQQGAGKVTIVAGSGVTINTARTLTTRAQYSEIWLTKTGTDTWIASGDLT